MYIWFARNASLMGWMIRTMMVMVVLMVVSQLLSKPALAVPTDTPQQSSSAPTQQV
jgi:hypothetical protein